MFRKLIHEHLHTNKHQITATYLNKTHFVYSRLSGEVAKCINSEDLYSFQKDKLILFNKY